MPARWPGLKCHLLTLLAVVLLVPASVAAQTQQRAASVTLTGRVSETVALAVPQHFAPDKVAATVVSTGNTVRLTLSGDEIESPLIRVPLLIRSNTNFKISAAVESQTAALAQISITDVWPMGNAVSPLAVAQLNIPPQFDGRRSGTDVSSPALDLSTAFVLVSGPRVSLAGTPESPNNALQITVFISLNPQPRRAWLMHLTFEATAGSPIQ